MQKGAESDAARAFAQFALQGTPVHRKRAGRCGRVANGVCIRLYDEDDFNRRPAFTDPEILRCSLAARSANAVRTAP